MTRSETAVEVPAHHRLGGGFRNPPGSPRQTAGLRDMLRFLFVDMRRASVPPIPAGHLAANPLSLAQLHENEIAWLGHACFAMRMAGQLILTDPYLSETAGPAGLGPKRFIPPAVSADALPRLDLIAISHNHYDHIDAKALRAYRWRAETPVICPLGVGKLMRKLGYEQVTELDWWQRQVFGELTVKCLPAVHFSGRGPFDRNRTLWASFSFLSNERKVWFGGDTAPGPVFREIGERDGPYDLAIVGIGAYEPRSIMQASHATPEEGIAIARDLGANAALGMHWGTVMLTPEDPFEAPERFRKAALEQQYGETNAWILPIGGRRAF
ncbi:MBL fold metallo-hydrolase [Qipengyuania oceanensis]|uniref:CMP-N-acetylneuraminate monooxygenase n=1 Tax=Qipengyuania oceanensis TaxID=1463597 RepID=A0A844YE30_9SPHN|nr:MBL fold metallo-hydrolase [Qipengyuania oceanensis]MXO61805.1 CMP-N-acetylneuraminate monooxygenase [Qipengyuania oceanensis]